MLQPESIQCVVVRSQVIGVQVTAVKLLAAETTAEVIRAFALAAVPHHAMAVQEALAAVAAKMTRLVLLAAGVLHLGGKTRLPG